MPALRAVGFHANRRLLDVQRCSHDGALGDVRFREVTGPVLVDGQRASAFPFAAPRMQTLFSALVLFCLLPRGFANRDVREHFAPLLGIDPSQITAGSMTYHLRRLRMHGLIERLPGTHRYRVTPTSLRTALFFTRTSSRIFRPGLAPIFPDAPSGDTTIRPAFDKLDIAIDRWIDHAKLSA